MKIQNAEQLTGSSLGRRDILRIAEAGLAAIDTPSVMRKLIRCDGGSLMLGVQRIDIDEVEKIIFIAIGKCAAQAAGVIEDMLGDRITRGVVIDVKECVIGLPQIRNFCGTHPLPSNENLKAAEAVVAALQGLTERDLVVFVISGGGSTLLFLPEDRSDRSEAQIFTALTAGGADIREMNIVRKHLSMARGGWLARALYPARSFSFIFSDVIGDDLSLIASGPTIKDETTVEDAAAILAKYDIPKTCGMQQCGLIETPKEDKYFVRAEKLLAVSNRHALEAMREMAEMLGYSAVVKSAVLTGEAVDVAHRMLDELHAARRGTVLLWGGETTVAVRNQGGNGGRNLTMAAAGLDSFRDGEILLPLASDGHDHGPYAGALCDTITREAADAAHVDPAAFLARNETYPFFEAIGNYLVTGDTGSNVSDLIIALKQK